MVGFTYLPARDCASMPDDPSDERAMTLEDAMRTMASVTGMTRGLRVRVEGLTLVIFALCIMASYLTIVVPILFSGGGGAPDPSRFNGTFNGTVNSTFAGGRPPGSPPTAFFLSRYAPLVWYLIAVVTTVGLWRMMSLNFQTEMTTPRLVAVFVSWLAIFVTVTVLLAFLEAGNPRAWHLLAWAIVTGLFAAANPLRFSTQARVATAIIAASALSTFLYAVANDLGRRDIGFLTGVALGLPGLVTGLWLMYRG